MFKSRFWIRSRTCQNGFFTLQFHTSGKHHGNDALTATRASLSAPPPAFHPPSNQALLPVRFLLPTLAHDRTKKGLLSGGRASLLHLLQYPQFLFALTKRHFFSIYHRGSDAPAQTAE